MRRLVVLLAAALLILGTAAPVAAKSMSLYRSTYYAVQFDWVQLDRDAAGNRLPPMDSRPLGNVHIGFAYAQEFSRGQAFVFGQIADLDCPVDFVPSPGGGHGIGLEEEPPVDPENPCTHIGFRSIDGQVPLSIDNKLTRAVLGGPGVTVGIYGGGDPHGGGGGLLANVPINVTFAGFGPLRKSTFTMSETDGTFTYTSRYSSNQRAAELTGVLGPMGFDPDLSGGSMSYNREVSRSRSR